MPKDMKATLRKANAAIANGDIEGFLNHCSENIKWSMIGDETIRGKKAVRAWLEKTYVHPPKFNAEKMLVDGNYLAVYGKIALQSKSGKVTRSEYCDVWRFKGGKMSELKAYAVEFKN